jgi:DNA invertase Pin-like site-specific DNA recombinase
MLIGYAHVSTDDQDLSLQCDALRQVACQKIYEDKFSGVRGPRPSGAI